MPHARRKSSQPPTSSSRRFVFCTGVENSYPVISDRKGKQVRRDGMELSGHYQHWRHDLKLVRQIGITYLRYGPPLYTSFQGPMKFDWSFADKTFAELRKLKIHPIADLCHFGVPDWLGNFQNPDFPPLFADYARAFAKRFPWVCLYTPVNEIFIAATYSGQYGWWNEQLKNDRGFVTALKHLARAAVLAEEAILSVRPDAIFIQSESSSYFHPAVPEVRDRAEFMNEKRFLSLDLCYGHDVTGLLHEYLLDNGVSREEYHWFLDHGRAIRQHCIMGTDYYRTNEYRVDQSKEGMQPAGEIFGYYVLAKEYFDRYHLPVMHTETNRKSEPEAPSWLWKEWSNILRLKRDGVPIMGFTWYSLLDQTDWDTGLREINHHVLPLGLFNLKRQIRPVGEAYRQLISQWLYQLPAESMARDLPSNPEDDQRPPPPSPRARAMHPIPLVPLKKNGD